MDASTVAQQLIDAGAGRRIQTPAFLVDTCEVEHRASALRTGIRAILPSAVLAYPYKSNSWIGFRNAVRNHVAYAEVSSLRELNLALADGFRGDQILAGGGGKSDAYLEKSLTIGTVLKVDSLAELRRIERTQVRGAPINKILLRLASRLGKGWSRLGLIPDELPDALRFSLRLTNDVGVHFHIGAQHEDNLGSIRAMTHSSAHLVSVLKDRLVRPSRLCINVGGGFPWLPGPKVVVGGTAWASQVKEGLLDGGLDHNDLEIVFEPGRAIVEGCGVLVTSIVDIKERDGWLLGFIDASSIDIDTNRTNRPVFVVLEHSPTKPMKLVGNLCVERDAMATNPNFVESGPQPLALFGMCGAYDIARRNHWIHDPPEIVDWAYLSQTG